MSQRPTSQRTKQCVLLIAVFVCFGNERVHAEEIAKTNSSPHVVFILLDDLGYGDICAFNPDSKIPTPHLDRIASQGMRFTDAHAAGPLCHLSRYGLMTGQYPFRAPVQRWAKRSVILPEQPTVAKLLRSAGYSTHMVGKWHVGFDEADDDPRFTGGPVDCGFDSFFGIRASTDIPPYFYIKDDLPVERPTKQIAANHSDGWSPIQGKFWRAGGIAPNLELIEVLPVFTRESIARIDRHAQSCDDKRLFLYVALPAPHTPWLPTSEFEGQGDASLYGEFVAMVDDAVGKIDQALTDNGLSDETLFVITSDNGPTWYPQDVERFEHDSAGGWRGMKADAWEAGHRMPMIVRWPEKVTAGATCDSLICLTDWLATLATITDQTLPSDALLDSIDFASVMTGEAEQGTRNELIMASGNGLFFIRSENWKLIDGLGSGGFTKPSRREPKSVEPAGQLYNLKLDPGETENKYAVETEIVDKLRERLRTEQLKKRQERSQ